MAHPVPKPIVLPNRSCPINALIWSLSKPANVVSGGGSSKPSSRSTRSFTEGMADRTQKVYNDYSRRAGRRHDETTKSALSDVPQDTINTGHLYRQAALESRGHRAALAWPMGRGRAGMACGPARADSCSKSLGTGPGPGTIAKSDSLINKRYLTTN